jgi:hypothetical protein
MLWKTHRQRSIDGDDTGPQGLHVFVILKPILLPMGVFQLIECRGNLGLEDEG